MLGSREEVGRVCDGVCGSGWSLTAAGEAGGGVGAVFTRRGGFWTNDCTGIKGVWESS